jgi:hypothetical protein
MEDSWQYNGVCLERKQNMASVGMFVDVLVDVRLLQNLYSELLAFLRLREEIELLILV